MRKIRFVPLVFLLFGFIGAVLRRMELATVFDHTTGLAERGAPVSVALLVMTVVVFASALALAVIAARSFDAPDNYKRAFYTGGYLSFIVQALLGLSLLVCAALLAFSDVDILGLSGMARWVFVIFMALGGLGMAIMAYSSYTLRDTSFLQLGSLIPSVFFCYWMVALYRVNAGNPVLLEYSYPCLGFAAAAMSAYYAAGYAYGRRNVFGAVCVGLFAVYLLPVTAMSPMPLTMRLPILAAAGFITINTSHLFDSLKTTEKKPAKE